MLDANILIRAVLGARVRSLIARFRRAGAGRVRENLWGSLAPDEPLDR